LFFYKLLKENPLHLGEGSVRLMTNHEIKINFQEYASVKELDTIDQDLCAEAVKAMKNSHSPYSKFRVAAALQLKSGKIIQGSNQENVAYPSGLCAERVALFYWGANHPDDPIISMAVTAHTDEFELKKARNLMRIVPAGIGRMRDRCKSNR
jgi:cytidine deaminase